MRLDKLFKVLVAGAIFTPTMMCTSASPAPATPVAATALAMTDATFDAGVVGAATDAMAEATTVQEIAPIETQPTEESEGVGAWLSW